MTAAEQAAEERKQPGERETTDESLRTERRKTDSQLAENLDTIHGHAEGVVADEREKADSVLSGAREHEDRALASRGPPVDTDRDVECQRAREDAALAATRDGADASAFDDRAARELALASLLALERGDTDLHLQIERTAADDAVTSRDDLLAMVSHDLRSLLGGIALNAALLKKLAVREVRAEKVGQCAESIQRFSARMNRLIGDLLDIARIDSGQLSMVHGLCDPGLLARDSVDSMQPAAAARHIALTSESTAGVEPIELDRERILQVLTNLIGNALKFTREGGRVSIRVEPRGSDVCLAVRDTGEGIAADRLSRIFDRFYQERRSDRRGLGLGLYISRSIVDAHRGRIWAESTPGRGSTFFFTLPARQLQAARQSDLPGQLH